MDSLVKIPEDSIVSICEKLLSLSGGRLVRGTAFDVIAPAASFFYARYMLKAPCVEDALDDLLADAAENDGPGLISFTREIADWSEALENRGFRKMVDQIGMLISLDDYAPRPADAHVERIGKDRVKAWSHVCEISFPKPPEIDSLRYWIGEEDCEFYAYVADGQILGTLLGYAADGNYGIHEVCTLPEQRRRGVCETLVHHALTSAKSAGNRYASLQASPAGARVYTRCGLTRHSTVSSWFLPQ